ncbi:holo-ACP synthase [Thermodesulfobacteriota bacterium]
MIIGTGIDIVKVDRIGKLHNKFGDKFLQRVFTEKEVDYCKNKKRFVNSLALRFAAKEAFLKSIKTGLRYDLKLTDIEILNDELGAPYINLYGATKKHAEGLKVKNMHVSLSDDGEYAVANVILEG